MNNAMLQQHRGLLMQGWPYWQKQPLLRLHMQAEALGPPHAALNLVTSASMLCSALNQKAHPNTSVIPHLNGACSASLSMAA